MTTLKESATTYANSADGSRHPTFEDDLVAAYLAGAKAALEMATRTAWAHEDAATASIKVHGKSPWDAAVKETSENIKNDIRNLIPE